MTKNKEKKITRKEIVSNIKEQILLSKNSENDVTFEYQSLFEQIEDFVIEMKSKGLIYKDIREFIELFVETPKVTTVSHNIQYPTLIIPDLDVTEKTVVQEGKAGKHNIVITELYKEEISRTKVIEESTITEIVKVPVSSESIVENDFSANSTEDGQSNVISYVGESYESPKAKRGRNLSVGIDINSSYKDDNLITVVFSDERHPRSFVCEQYKNYLASLKKNIGFDPMDQKFNSQKTAGTFYRKTLNIQSKYDIIKRLEISMINQYTKMYKVCFLHKDKYRWYDGFYEWKKRIAYYNAKRRITSSTDW